MNGPDNLFEPDHAELRCSIAALRKEHRALDAQIEALTEQPGMSQLEIKRLKKQKLQLKDRITTLQNRVVPDIIA